MIVFLKILLPWSLSAHVGQSGLHCSQGAEKGQKQLFKQIFPRVEDAESQKVI